MELQGAGLGDSDLHVVVSLYVHARRLGNKLFSGVKVDKGEAMVVV